MIDDLSAIQKKELYDLNSQFDLKQLDDPDKELLIAGLYTLAAMNDSNYGLTIHQQAFIRSVQKYVGVSTPQTSVNLSIAIENVENLTVQKVMLQVFMEFLFLEKEDDSFLNDYDELFDLFSVKKKDKDIILGQVHTVYNATGTNGISEKYGYVPPRGEGYNEYDNSLVIVREIDNTPAPEIKRLDINDKLTIEYGKTKKIEDKDVHLKANIECKGTLQFVNCKITSYVSDEGLKNFIHMVRSAKVSFENCLIICEADNTLNLFQVSMIFKSGQSGAYHLLYADYGDKGNGGSSVEFNNCNIIGHSCLLNIAGAKILVRNSYIENPMPDFIHGTQNPGICIEDSEIHFKNLHKAKVYVTERNSSDYNAIFNMSGYFGCFDSLIRNCKFMSDGSRFPGKGYDLFNGYYYTDDDDYDNDDYDDDSDDGFKEHLTIENCEFKNLQQSFGSCGLLKESFFSSCKKT